MKIRHNWQTEQILALYQTNLIDLIFKAQKIHRKNFTANKIQLSTLLNIKTGACPEDCAYCSQSVHNKTNLKKEKLLDLDKVVAQAKKAKQNGANRFCMGAAWRNPTDKNLDKVIAMIKQIKALGLETCTTLGMLNQKQATKLKQAGLDYYNHNLDTSESFYPQIISTRSYQDRLDTLANVQKAGLKVCAGGILGMGENRQDRADLLKTLANLPVQPQSVPINQLVSIKGTQLQNAPKIDEIEFIKTIAIARIIMPQSYVRLSAGRQEMNQSTQALCFFAGANSIFYGDELLTTDNQSITKDIQLFAKLGLEPEQTSLKQIQSQLANQQHNSKQVKIPASLSS